VANDGVPSLVMSQEHSSVSGACSRAARRAELEIDVEAAFEAGDGKSYNTVAEIPGSDSKAGYVDGRRALDSWHAGDGATDDGAGVAVVMEAARILKTLGVKPRRAIRFALWSGEEQGFFGSLAYVRDHLATRPEPKDPKELEMPRFLRKPTWPIQPLPEHGQMHGYSTTTAAAAGSSASRQERRRGAVFRAWLKPSPTSAPR
jgi:hypothetical protein